MAEGLSLTKRVKCAEVFIQTLRILQGRMDLLGPILFAMLFLQYTIQANQPASVLIPPYVVSLSLQSQGPLPGELDSTLHE